MFRGRPDSAAIDKGRLVTGVGIVQALLYAAALMLLSFASMWFSKKRAAKPSICLELKQLAAYIEDANLASARVFEKCGFMWGLLQDIRYDGAFDRYRFA
jgi:hypothetical protein